MQRCACSRVHVLVESRARCERKKGLPASCRTRLYVPKTGTTCSAACVRKRAGARIQAARSARTETILKTVGAGLAAIQSCRAETQTVCVGRGGGGGGGGGELRVRGSAFRKYVNTNTCCSGNSKGARCNMRPK